METWQICIIGAAICAAVLIAAFMIWRAIKRLEPLLDRFEASVETQEVASTQAEANAEGLKIGIAAQKELGEDDRRQIRELLVDLGMSNAKAMIVLTENVENIRQDARKVAVKQQQSQDRADQVKNQPHGAAADAASKSGKGSR